jgi:hypothetical protein
MGWWKDLVSRWFVRWNESVCKSLLKTAEIRARLLQKKLGANWVKHRREISRLLQAGDAQQPFARTLAEKAINDHRLSVVLEIIATQCHLLQSRVSQLDKEDECPDELLGAVGTVLYCAPMVDLPELKDVRQQFERKYGVKGVRFIAAGLTNLEKGRYAELVDLLRTDPPEEHEVGNLLERVKIEVGLPTASTQTSSTLRTASTQTSSTRSTGSKRPHEESQEPEPAQKKPRSNENCGSAEQPAEKETSAPPALPDGSNSASPTASAGCQSPHAAPKDGLTEADGASSPSQCEMSADDILLARLAALRQR